MKSIVLHDYFKFMEGGGRLSLILAQKLKSDLGYGFRAKNHPFFDTYQITGGEYNLNVSGFLPGWRNFGLIRAFLNKTNFVKKHKIAVYSGFYAPLAVENRTGGKNYYYCHTPPRYIYDQRQFYFSHYPIWAHPIIKSLISYHQPLYEAATKKMDGVITNSLNVKKRIKKFLGIDATVVYPPCETAKFKWSGQGDYYLSAARLDPLKRVDIIVNAFKRMPDQKLLVVSDGPAIKNIKKLARKYSNISILGRLSDHHYRRLMGECIASIYVPKDEDFGMTPIESMAAGKPVIGVNHGGLTESIRDYETGILLPPDPLEDDIVHAVRWLNKNNAKRMLHSCQENAKRFDVKVFISKMNEIFG